MIFRNRLVGLKQILFTFIVFFTLEGFGQTSFHRTYDNGGVDRAINLYSLQLNDGNYLSLELLNDQADLEIINNLLITNYDPKGNVQWSRRLYTGADSIIVNPTFSKIIVAKDSVFFTTVFTDEEKTHNLVGALNRFGELAWVKKHTLNDDALGQITNNLITSFGSKIFKTTSLDDTTNGNFVIGQLNTLGDLAWSKIFRADDDAAILVSPSAIEMTKDTSVVITGLLEGDFIDGFILEVDTVGNVIWSKKYTDVTSLLGFPFIQDVAKLDDSTFVAAGFLLEFVFPNNFLINGFIIKTDTSGNVQWSRKVTFGLTTISGISNLTIAQDGNILIGGSTLDVVTEEGYHWMAKLRPNGQVIWQKKFPRIQGRVDFQGNLFVTNDGGGALINTAEDGVKVFTSFIKVDQNGVSSCEEDIVGNIFINHSFVADTLIWTSIDSGKMVVYNGVQEASYSYNIPTISLRDSIFCPNDPINYTFSTPIPGAVFYEWSNGIKGDSASAITVMDTEQYSVTVTIDNGKECYMMCDTTQLQRFTEPGVTIIESLGDFCTTGEIRLTRNYTPGGPGINSRLWSTGESTDFIDVGTTGIYRVTITDSCNEVAVAEYTVAAIPVTITAASILKDFSAICDNRTGRLAATGNAQGLTMTYLWNDLGGNSTSQEIIVNEAGTYIVTVTDQCGNTATASILVPESDFRRVTVEGIDVDQSDFCRNGDIDLTVRYTGDANIVWSTGNSDFNKTTITVKSEGTYTVTITDKQCPSVFVQLSTSFTVPTIIQSISFLEPIAVGDDCEDGLVEVSVVIVGGEPKSIVWSNGIQGERKIVTDIYQSYTVTVTDICDKQFIESVEVQSPDVILKYANIFFPETRDTLTRALNATFGPIVTDDVCIGAVTDYEFYIFNRWGQKVFESNAVGLEWNGSMEGNNQDKNQTEVYMWRVRYKAFGREFNDSGDVTLMRTTGI